jgi:hypothetical protein
MQPGVSSINRTSRRSERRSCRWHHRSGRVRKIVMAFAYLLAWRGVGGWPEMNIAVVWQAAARASSGLISEFGLSVKSRTLAQLNPALTPSSPSLSL